MAEALDDLCDGRHTKQAKTTFTKIKKPQNCPPRIMKDAVAEINSYPHAGFQGRGQQRGFYTIPGKHGFLAIFTDRKGRWMCCVGGFSPALAGKITRFATACCRSEALREFNKILSA